MPENKSDHITYRNLVHNQISPYIVFKGWWHQILVETLSYGIQWPWVGRWIRHSFAAVCTALSRLRRRGDYRGLYTLLINALLGSAFRHRKTYLWWYLMRFAVAVAQERQINWMVRDFILEDNLILMGTLGPKPWVGYDVAYAFVGFSLWLFERGDIQGAVNMIQISVQADETWGYPEYLYGWYGLFTPGIDSVTHFSRAVQIDWSFFQRMKLDKTCSQHPELLREVQKRTLVSK